MKWLKKRSTAVLVLVLMMVLSVLGIGGNKLQKERERIENVFYEGKAGFSVWNDIKEMRETGYNLLHIAEKAGDAAEEQRTAASAWSRLNEDDEPENTAAACKELVAAITALDEVITFESDDLRDSWERQRNSFFEYYSHIRFDSYYDERAEEYNHLFDDPLTSLIGRITGRAEMPRFTESIT